MLLELLDRLACAVAALAKNVNILPVCHFPDLGWLQILQRLEDGTGDMNFLKFGWSPDIQEQSIWRNSQVLRAYRFHFVNTLHRYTAIHKTFFRET